jgi:ferrous iron transport protein B
VNVVDACALERNLFFTLQLLELETPLVIALNQMDSAEKKGLRINHHRLGELLQVPIVPMVAIRGVGFSDLLDKIIEVYENKKNRITTSQEYGREIEQAVTRLEREIQKIDSKYPSRWLAIKLLEDDEEVKKIVYNANQSNQTLFEEVASEIEGIHGESPNIYR